jgi:drug/metabolite transporter (DMT)-like permease
VTGILAVSSAAILVRFAQRDAPSLAIAAWRLGLAAALLIPIAAIRHAVALRSLSARDRVELLLAGTCLAAHFAAWIASLEHTSVARSVVLVSTTPVWVALLSPAVLHERVPRVAWWGLGLALAGAAAMTGARAAGGARASNQLGGDALALAGAVAMAGVLLVGRRLRRRLPLLAHVAAVYGAAAALLLGAAAATGAVAAPLPARAWGWIALLALVPQLTGHTLLNWAVRCAPAAFVSVALLGEPVGAALLAAAVLGETPTAREALGATLVLAGIATAGRAAADQAGPSPGL